MPSVKNPGLLTPRAGQVPAKTVPSAGLIQPNRDVEPLKAHLNDPSRAHMASAIGIVDAGGFYSSDEVEGALQEVGGGAASSRQNGVISGCTFTTAGTTLTLDAGSKILFKGMLRDVSGESVAVSAGTKYIYFDGTTGVLTANAGLIADLTLGFVLVAQVVSSGAAITSSIDLRFFVVSLDRKVDYTVRDGGLNQANDEAEACFVTLEAAFFWLNNFAPSVESKRTLIVRGAHTVTDTLTLAQSGVEIRGEGGATITFTSASLNLINCTATDDVIFRDLTFLCNGTNPNVTAFATSISTTNFLFERCKFTQTGALRWYYGIYAIDLLGNQQRMVVRDCYFNVNQNYCAAIFISDGFECSFENVKIDGGGYWLGSVGILLGSTFGASESRNRISGLHVDNMAYGVSLSTAGVGTVITGCYLKDVRYGIFIGSGSEETVVSDCDIELDSTGNGLTCVLTQSDRCTIQGSTFKTAFGTAYPAGFLVNGIKVEAADHTTLANNTYLDFRCVGSNSQVDGIFAINAVGLNISGSTFLNSSITVAGNGTGVSRDVVISENIFRATTAEAVSYAALRVWGTSGAVISNNRLFLNSAGVATQGRDGIQVGGGSLSYLATSFATGYSMNVAVSGNSISAATLTHIQIAGDVRGFTVAENAIDGFKTSDVTTPGYSGINVRSTGSLMAGTLLSPSNGTINGNMIRRCRDGILVEGDTALRIRGMTLTGNSVSECVKCSDGSDNFDDKGCKGIGLNYVSDSVVSSNTIRDIGIIRDNSGLATKPATDAIFGLGVYLRDCARVNVTSNTITDVYAFDYLATLGLYRGIFWQISDAALSPVATENDGLFITDNILTVTPEYPSLTQNPPNAGSSGISVVIDPASGNAIWYSACIEGNEIHSGLKSPSPYANPYGIYVSIQGATAALDVQDFSTTNNTVSGFLYYGMIFNMSGASGNARTVRVKNNSVKHTTAAGSEVGIQFVSNCSVLDLSIDSNDLTPDATSNEAFAGIDVSLTDSGTLRRVSVSDNQIQTRNRAIFLNVPSATLSDFKVVGNEVAMTSPTTTGTEAIYLIGDNADGLSVDRNSVTYTSALAQDDTTAILVTLGSVISGVANDNISISSNSIYGNLGILGGTTGFVGIGFSPNNDVNNCAINDNSIRMSSTNTSDTMKHGIAMYLTDTTTAGAVLWYLSACGNKISNANTSSGQATATATVTATPSTATLTIGGQPLTPAGGPRTSGSNNYDNTLGSFAAIRDDIVAAINDPLNGFAAIATAFTGAGGLLNLTAVPFGSLGDAVTLVSSNGTLIVSGPTFTGGSGTVPHGALVLHGETNSTREARLRTLNFSHNKIDGTATALTGVVITSSSSGNWTLIGNSSLFFGPAAAGLLQGCFTSQISNFKTPYSNYPLTNSTCMGNISGDAIAASVTGTCDASPGGSTINTLKDTGAGWAVNAYAGYWVTITNGTGVTQSRIIVSNTADTLTISPYWLVIPDSSTYSVQQRRGFQGLGVNVTPFPIVDFNVDI